ncbi:MAG: universal stress protein [Thaumarchaeota archaeon]|nr:universal stress protein [Nitrososphaerota archaeon]
MAKKVARILAPLDGSKNSLKALDLAIYLARQFRGTVTGLFVLPFYLPPTGPRVFGPYRKEMASSMRKFLTAAKVMSAKNGIAFTGKIIDGDVISDDVADFAKKGRFDLIVISSHGKGQVGRWLLGSVTYSVLHKSKVPVLVVK